MQPNTRIVVAFACVLALLALPGLGLAQKKGKGGGEDGVIRLEANWDDAFSDNVRSDGQGAYVSGGNVIVEINKDGDFRFTLDPVGAKRKRAGRTIVLRFPEIDRLAAGDSGASPPDPAEPVNGIFFRTMLVSAEPTVNFRLMKPGDVKPVRLFIPFSTTERSDFWLRFDPDTENPGTMPGGNVQVTAVDSDDDGLVDQWVLEPLPGTDSKAKLIRDDYHPKTGHQITDFGDFRMPFLLTLDRLE